MLKAVIFDMDGVLVDTEPIYFEIDKRVMKKCNFIADDSILSQYVGISNLEMWVDLKKKYNFETTVEELLNIQSELRIKVLNERKIDAIDGIKDLLNELKENRLLLAVASSSSRPLIEHILDSIKIKEYFNITVSGEEVKRGKPYPDIFLKAAELLNVKPAECMVIEDSANGVKSAKSAGMKCIGYFNRNSGSQDLSNASAIVESICSISCEFMRDMV